MMDFLKNPIVIGIAVVIGCISLSMLAFTTAEERLENAKTHAHELGLEDARVTCDKSWGTCGCSISWRTPEGRRVQSFACCGSGCE